jgi:sugar lactone lactonase YvrE
MSVIQRGACNTCLRKPLMAVRLCLLLLMAFVTNLASAQLSPGGPVDFGSTPLNTAVTATLTFEATTATVVSVAGVYTDGAILKDFQLGKDTCTGLIVPPSVCNITVIFNPTQVGERHGAMLVVDSGNNVINKTFLHGIGQGANFAMSPAVATTLASAPSLTISTFTTSSATSDGNGNLFFTDIQNGRILEMVPAGTITSIASLPVTANSSIVVAGDGTLYVSAGSAVYSFLPGDTPTAIATTGNPNITLIAPTGLAIDAYGGLFIADSAAGKIVRYSLTGSGSNYVPVLGLTPLSNPTGLGVDDNQNLYIADTGNNRIVEINPANSVVTAATIVPTTGFTLSAPQGVAVDSAGTIYIADTGNARILEMTTAGIRFPLTDPSLTLQTPTALRVRVTGDLVISDNSLGLITVPRSMPAVTFPTPTIVGTLDSTDDPLYLSVQSIGNITASLIVPQTGTNPYITTKAFLLAPGATCPSVTAGQTTVTSFAVGAVCAYPVDFSPIQLGINKANLILQTTGPAATGPGASAGSATANYTATVPLTGNAVSGIASFTLVASPNINTVGGSDSLTLTALMANGSTAQYYVGTVTFTTTDSTGKFLGGTTYTFTAADNGVLYIPAATGIQFNQTGDFTVSATDGTFSVTSNIVHIVNASSMTLTSSVNPTSVNQSTNFTATVSNAGAAATGLVSFFSNSVLIGAAALVNGVASIPDSFPACGTYPITASYGGDLTTAAATAGPLSQAVLCNVSSTSTLTSSKNPSSVGDGVVFTATLVGTGSTPPTGTVQFFSNGLLIGSATLVNGVATDPTYTFSAAGSYTITAVYSGDSANAPFNLGPLTQVVVNTAAMTLTSSINPSLVNQSTTFTATITTSGVAPVGSVNFYSAGVLIGSGTLNGAGVATLPYAFAAPGKYAITATYAGDPNTAAAKAGPLSQVVLYPITSTNNSFTSSVNPSQVNQSTTLSLTLTSAGPTPTGTVTFYSNVGVICTATVVNGVASCPVSFTAAGTYPLTAVYSGDSATAPFTAGPLQQVVLDTSTMALTSSVNPTQVNGSTTFTAIIATSGVPATGTVNFYSNGTLIGPGTLVNGVATIHDSFPVCGVYPITATYAGNGTTAAASAGPLSQVVLCSVTNGSTLTSSKNPSLVGDAVVFTATLVSTGPTPTGNVKFYSGTTLIGTAPLIGGVASNPSYIFTAPGTYPITAVYSGDGNNAGYTLGPLAQVVNYQPSISLTSLTNPVLISAKTQLLATIASSGIAPTGTVSFYDGAVLIGTATVSGNITGGTATLLIGFSTIGLHPLTAVYSGDTNYAKATSGIYQQDVVDPTTAVLGTNINPSLVNQSVAIVVTITSAAPTITGLVTFYDGGVSIGSASVTGTIATINYAFTTVGTHQLTCSYAGDLNNASATCAAYAQVVNTQATVVLTSAVNPSLVNQSVQFTATVTAPGHSPGGSVTFFNSSNSFATIPVTSGQAIAPETFTAVGTYPMKAVYSGDPSTAAATSNTVNQLVVNPVTFTLSTSVNPVNVNAPVTFTATGSGFTGTAPTGSVQFFSNGILIGKVNIGVGLPPTAALPTSFATVGTDTITCIYSGDGNYASTPCSPAIAEVVVNPTTSILTVNPNPVLLGSSTTLTATVTSAGGNIPTGLVTFTDGGVVLGTGNLSAGVANLLFTFTTTGAHSLSCTYAGDASDAGSTCNIVILDVVQPTILTLVDTPNPSIVGQTVTFTTNLTSSSVQPITGTIKIFNGLALLCTTTAGGAPCTYAFPLAGTFLITAVYSGDAYHSGATSNIVSQVVLNRATIVLTSSPNPVLVNNLAVLTVVATSTGPTPTGIVSFYDGNAPIGNANLAAGTANLTVTFPGSGIHTLTAIYAGDPVTAPAISNTVSETVTDYSLAVTTGTPSSFTGIAGSTASYSLTLTPLVLPTLISNVTFSVDALPKGMIATFTPTSVATGSGPATVALTLMAPAITGQMHDAPKLPSRSRLAPIAFGLLLLPIALIRKRKKLSSVLLLLLLAAGFTGLTGCITSPSSGYYGQVQQTYNLTVNATSGNLTRTTVVTFVVQ